MKKNLNSFCIKAVLTKSSKIQGKHISEEYFTQNPACEIIWNLKSEIKFSF